MHEEKILGNTPIKVSVLFFRFKHRAVLTVIETLKNIDFQGGGIPTFSKTRQCFLKGIPQDMSSCIDLTKNCVTVAPPICFSRLISPNYFLLEPNGIVAVTQGFFLIIMRGIGTISSGNDISIVIL